MIIAETIKDVRRQVSKWHAEGLTVGLVPTMGALHEGHASLVKTAVKECDRVVASVFVNPTQFGKNEDLDSYPRNFERDCEILSENGCDMVFHPEVDEMYPEGFATYMNLESEMTAQLCGKSRPGHFRGVCTVVGKLFNIVTPDRAYFGEKDAQQLAVIRQMVRDMNFGLDIVGCPTVREADGLAKSSRNTYLNSEEREAARVLYKSIETAKNLIQAEGAPAASDVIETMISVIAAEPMAEIDYIEAVDGTTLEPVEFVTTGTLVALAVKIGNTRLIDNFTVNF